MGSGSSKSVRTVSTSCTSLLKEREPIPKSTQDDEEEEETGSDFIDMNVEEAKEENNIEEEPQNENYQRNLPPEPKEQNNIQLCKTPKFYFLKNLNPQSIGDYQNIKTPQSTNIKTPQSTNIKTPQSTNIKTPQSTNTQLPSDSKQPKNVTRIEIDARAKEAPATCVESFSKLNEYLLADLQEHTDREELTVRALIVWLGHQNIDDFKSDPADETTLRGNLSLLANRRTRYSTVFTILCRHAYIMCIKIKGVSRCGNYEPGDTECNTDYWTVVSIKNEWQLIHPFWVCRSLVGYTAKGWIKIEEGGTVKNERKTASEGELVQDFKEYYFLINPYEFMYCAHPDDTKWQLTKKQISKEDFLQLPYVFSTFFGLGLKIISEERCHLKTENGEQEVRIQAPIKTANRIELHYELYLKDKQSSFAEEQVSDRESQMSNFVSMIRCGDHWQFKMRFPSKGTYKLCVYGGVYMEPLARIATFRIDCNETKEKCLPSSFDPGRTGFGPGPKAEDAGLFVPSHVNGIVPAVVEKDINITFQVDVSIVKIKNIRVQLRDYRDNAPASPVTCTIKKQELKITTSLKKMGEYALTIDKRGRNPNTDRSLSHTPDDYNNICNYLLSTKLKSRERANQKNARIALRDDLSKVVMGEHIGKSINKIKSTLTICGRAKIPDTDTDIMAAKTKLGFLKAKKDLRDAGLRNNIHILEDTIARVMKSEYHRVCRNDIKRLEKLKKSLIFQKTNG